MLRRQMQEALIARCAQLVLELTPERNSIIRKVREKKEQVASALEERYTQIKTLQQAGTSIEGREAHRKRELQEAKVEQREESNALATKLQEYAYQCLREEKANLADRIDSAERKAKLYCELQKSLTPLSMVAKLEQQAEDVSRRDITTEKQDLDL